MKLNQQQLTLLTDRLLAEGREKKWLEVKDSFYDPHVIGEYLSALSNSAAIDNQEKGYLLFGVDDSSFSIVGTTFQPSKRKHKNQPLEFWLNQILQPKIGFDIYEYVYQGNPMVLFAVNPADGTPVKFDGKAYIRIESCKTELKNHPTLERRIWAMGSPDWTSLTSEGAKLSDLSPEALVKAKEQYKIKHQNNAFYGEIDGWDDITLLNKAGLAIEGRLTNAAIILLGKPESENYIQPSVAQITWILKDQNGLEKDYLHFKPPFILEVDNLFAKIRNLTIREMPDGTLFPVEITQYDSWVMREALHNCIAHQDYQMCSRIVVVENQDSLLFVNSGSFIPGTVENALHRDAPQRYYPNRSLADAMVNLNMIDTIGSGIKRMFSTQKIRFMPMPDYDFSVPDEVKVRLSGRILDENYTKLLINQTDLSLDQVIFLDKVQKQIKISKDAHRELKKQNLVEGRYPNLHVSVKLAKETGSQTDYTKQKGFDKQYYKDLVLKYIDQFSSASKEDILKLLKDKLPAILSEEQKENKVKNLLAEMSAQDDSIVSRGSTNKATWIRKS